MGKSTQNSSFNRGLDNFRLNFYESDWVTAHRYSVIEPSNVMQQISDFLKKMPKPLKTLAYVNTEGIAKELVNYLKNTNTSARILKKS